jgi:hypothetical protein
MSKPILCLDFDGVIHSYTSGWQGVGVCADPPVNNTLTFLYEATKVFKVAIYSSRSKSLAGRAAMRRYMREHFNLSLTFSPDHDADWLHEAVYYPWFKPSAFITIDDRALTFNGSWGDYHPASLLAFKPWNKRADGPKGQDGQLRDEPKSAPPPQQMSTKGRES